MREIKFRAWDNQYKKYITSQNEDEDCDACMGFKFDTEGYYFENDGSKVTRFIFEQFTGFHDKNGKEIYEGDIVKSIDSDFNRVIKWSDITPSFTMQRDDFKECVWYNEKYCEVIGNIHENPELISEQQNEK